MRNVHHRLDIQTALTASLADAAQRAGGASSSSSAPPIGAGAGHWQWQPAQPQPMQPQPPKHAPPQQWVRRWTEEEWQANCFSGIGPNMVPCTGPPNSHVDYCRTLGDNGRKSGPDKGFQHIHSPRMVRGVCLSSISHIFLGFARSPSILSAKEALTIYKFEF